MGTRGRASAASLTVISSQGVEQIRRPSPPSNLSKEAADEWKAIVNRMPPDWFPRETHAMLAQLCRTIVRANQVAKLFDAKKSLTAKDFGVLLKNEQQLSRTIGFLSTKMRISQQSAYDKRKRRDHVPKNQPWEDEEGEVEVG